MRFRISSLEPMDCSDEIVDLVGGVRRASRRIFISRFSMRAIDAGRDAAAVHPGVLPPARRSHSREIPHASIGTDIIVGFPGESDADFAAARDVPRGRARSPTFMCFPIPTGPAPRPPHCPDKVHGSIVRERASRRSRHRARASTSAFHRGAARHGPARSDNRGWLAGGDGQLSQGEDSAGLAAQRVGDRRSARSASRSRG